jgi:hypothetical protein
MVQTLSSVVRDALCEALVPRTRVLSEDDTITARGCQYGQSLSRHLRPAG